MSRKVQHRTITPPQRFRLVQDDSCHWYAIPADKRQEFDLWVEACEGDDYDTYISEDFEEFRLGMHPSNHTFTDLKEDR